MTISSPPVSTAQIRAMVDSASVRWRNFQWPPYSDERPVWMRKPATAANMTKRTTPQGNKPHRLNHEQHKLWVREMLAPSIMTPGEKLTCCESMLMRDRGRHHGYCECLCGWKGVVGSLIQLTALEGAAARRPEGYCPQCQQRPFWMKMTEAQAALLAP
jgi:hypothetical protein